MAEEKKKDKKIKAYIPLAKMCPKCGSRLANHQNRFSCGKCGYTEFKDKNKAV